MEIPGECSVSIVGGVVPAVHAFGRRAAMERPASTTALQRQHKIVFRSKMSCMSRFNFFQPVRSHADCDVCVYLQKLKPKPAAETCFKMFQLLLIHCK